FETQTVRFANGMFKQFAPFRGEERGAVRDLSVAALFGAAGIADNRPAEALGGHFFKVAGDRSFCNVSVEPPPIGAKFCVAGRIGKAGFKLVSLRAQEA